MVESQYSRAWATDVSLVVGCNKLMGLVVGVGDQVATLSVTRLAVLCIVVRELLGDRRRRDVVWVEGALSSATGTLSGLLSPLAGALWEHGRVDARHVGDEWEAIGPRDEEGSKNGVLHVDQVCPTCW